MGLMRKKNRSVRHNFFEPPYLLVEGLLSTGHTPSSFYLLVEIGLPLYLFLAYMGWELNHLFIKRNHHKRHLATSLAGNRCLWARSGILKNKKLLLWWLLYPFGGRSRVSARSSVRKCSISRDVNCLVGLEGGGPWPNIRAWLIGFGLNFSFET